MAKDREDVEIEVIIIERGAGEVAVSSVELIDERAAIDDVAEVGEM